MTTSSPPRPAGPAGAAPAGAPARDHLFISYRRDDARGASGRLYDWLRIAFGRERVFRDVASIGIGRWHDKIDAALARSALLLAVIGPRWADATHLPRLADPRDMVRHELLAALADDRIVIVPALVEGATPPAAGTLPAELQPLFDVWNARPLSEAGWEDDTRRLIAEIHEATGLPVGRDLDRLLHDVAAAELRLAELDTERQLQQGQIDALRGTVDELRRKLAEAPAAERPALAEAFAALARGDTGAAEAAFEREFEARHQQQEAARQAKVDAALNVANLAMLHDIQKAVRFYGLAVQTDPERSECHRRLAHALIPAGDLTGAEAAFREALRLARNQRDERSESTALHGLGDVQMSRGLLQEACASYTQDLDIATALAAREPGDTQSQRDLSVSHDRLGELLISQGQIDQALAHFRKGLAIAETLAAHDPANTMWQRDLSVSHQRIGDVLATQGLRIEALAAFRISLDIVEKLAKRDQANTVWLRDISVSHNRIGAVLFDQGQRGEALAAFRKGQDIAEELAARDPANTEWQRDLSISHNKIGHVQVAQGQVDEALAAYRKGLAIAETLAARDPANVQWQTDVAVTCMKLGTTELGQGVVERRRYLARALDIVRPLAVQGRLTAQQGRWPGLLEKLLDNLDRPE